MRWTRPLERLLGWEDTPDAGLLREVRPLVDAEVASENELGSIVDALMGEPFGEDELARRSRIPRLRPVLVVLAARAAGADKVDPELQYAAELLYAALNVHDVALGPRGGKRRKSLRRLVKRSVGWLGGNQLTLRAMELVRIAGDGESLGELVDTLREFSDAQAVAAELLEQGHPDSDLWQEHADGHTGALFRFCCRSGALLAGAPPAEVAALGRFGRHVGRLWHIAEDVVLLRSPEAAEHLLGRALMGRPMLPVAVGVARDPSLGPMWRRLVDEADPDVAEAIVARLRAVHAIRGTRELALREAWTAQRTLRRLDETPYARSLERLAHGLATAPFDSASERVAEAGQDDLTAEVPLSELSEPEACAGADTAPASNLIAFPGITRRR